MSPREIGRFNQIEPTRGPQRPQKTQKNVPTTIPQMQDPKDMVNIEGYMGLHGITSLQKEDVPFTINSPLKPDIVTVSGEKIATLDNLGRPVKMSKDGKTLFIEETR